MIFEEYCSYILSRERDIEAFTIPGSNVKINKNEFLINMRAALKGMGYKDYDSLLMATLKCCVNKDHIAKNNKFDKNMDAVLNNISSRFDKISTIYKSMDRKFPFSYERIFEILVYYLRLITNIINSDKEKQVSYVTADISPEAVLYVLNRKLSMDSLDAEWEKIRWKTFYKDIKPFSTGAIDYYIKFILLATYIRYREIIDN